MLLNEAGKVWIGRRISKTANDQLDQPWQMPQGGIDEDETPRAAALRELAEETGAKAVEVIAESKNWYSYDLPEELIGVPLKGKYRGQRLRWFAMRYLGRDEDFEISGQSGHTAEFDAWRWTDIGQLAGLAVPFKREIYRSVVAEFLALAAPK